ncbi:hypothetical protein POM88_046104 [Heracleum sosnowskyi]|uniref:Uncharacterized protein n=1 Tax=Heracleum sosnowskyi TaxID=360622 RepID=A0AAD8H8N0_9APIA|nr:hypothetical protein POM88_046104 [Heracleum sosnowskyi]
MILSSFDLLENGDDRSWHLFTKEDMVQGYKKKFKTTRKKINYDKENIGSSIYSGRSSSPLSLVSRIFNTPVPFSVKSQLSSVNKLPKNSSFSGTMRNDVIFMNRSTDKEPLSDITNLPTQSLSRSGKKKLCHKKSTRNLFEEDFQSNIPEISEEYYDQLEHSIIVDSSVNEDGSDDSNEEPWGESVNSDPDVENLPSSSKCQKQRCRRCDILEEYATLGAPSVKCTKYNVLMRKEERVNKNVTKGTPIFSLCCKKRDVKLPNAFLTPTVSTATL